MRPSGLTRLLMAGVFAAVGGCEATYRAELDSPDPLTRVRAIYEVVTRGDRSALPLLVDRLEDEDEAVRFYAIEGLKKMVGTDMGYKFYEPASERLVAVRRWRRYVRERSAPAATTSAAANRK